MTKEFFHSKPDYRAIWYSLSSLRDHLLLLNIVKLAILKLGCRLDKLDWGIVRNVVQELHRHTEIEVLVWWYNPWIRGEIKKTVNCYFYATFQCTKEPDCRYRHKL